MNCTEFRAAYSEFVDGFLDEVGEVAAHRHMSECQACRRFHEALQWGVGELKRQPKVLVSQNFHARLEARIRAESSGFTPVVRSWPGAAAMLMSLTLAAAAALAIEMSHGGPARHAAQAGTPTVLSAYTPRMLGRARVKTRTRTPAARADSFDVAGYAAAPAGQLASVWSAEGR